MASRMRRRRGRKGRMKTCRNRLDLIRLSMIFKNTQFLLPLYHEYLY